jgi:hypothetical protein
MTAMRQHETDAAAPEPAEAVGAEVRLAARAWRILAVIAALTGSLLLALTRANTALTLGAAGALTLVNGAFAAVHAFGLTRTRPPAPPRRPSPGGAAGPHAVVAALTLAAAVLAAISLLT